MNPQGALGIVLAGGAGERLGAGVPKALVPLAGRTLLERAVETLEAVCDAVVVAAPRTLALPGATAKRADDPPGAAGPLAGMLAGWRTAPGHAAIVLGVDFPLVRPAMLEMLHARLGAYAAVIPHPGGRAQPLVAVYAPGVRAVLETAFAAGERSIVRATSALDADRPDDEALERMAGGAAAFLNVNTQADLEAAARRLG